MNFVSQTAGLPPRTLSPQQEKKLFWKISLRILVVLFITVMMVYVDSVNLGIAKLAIQEELKLSPIGFGWAASIFYVGYVCFEIPSNFLLTKIGAKKTFVRISLLWGLTTLLTLFVKTEGQLQFMRLILGVFEAGFFPGMMYYITLWYAPQQMGKAVAILTISSPIGGILGSLFGGYALEHMHGLFSISGWQWIYLIEGVVTLLCSLVIALTFIDSPEQAKFLSPEEREHLKYHSSFAQNGRKDYKFSSVLMMPRLYLLSFGYFTMIASFYLINYWFYSLISDLKAQEILQQGGALLSAALSKITAAHPDLSHTDALLQAAKSLVDKAWVGKIGSIPYWVQILVLVPAGMLADKVTRHRRPWCFGFMVVGTLFLTFSAYSRSWIELVVFISCAKAFMITAYTIFWTLPSEYVRGSASAASTALINTIGVMGAIVGPSMMGVFIQWTGSPKAGFLIFAALMLVGAVFILLNRVKAEPAANAPLAQG